jgi:alkylglycerol monooxygenase
MYPDIIAISIPFLVGSVVVEYLYDRRQRVKQYRLNAMMSNMGCGVAEQITGFISKGLFLAVYALIWSHFRVATIPDNSVWTWVALVLAVDLTFYFFHRACHRHNLLWSGHVVHHEVEEFNLTVALRRSVLQEFLIIPAYLPLAVIGFSPGAFFLIFAAHNLYQFLIHTPYLPEMRWAGLIFNTPHHHTVHHGRNARYLDRNFAGIFIVWDKLFGTFEPMVEAPVFGVHQKTTTLNPVRAQLTTFGRVLQRAARAEGLAAKLRVFWESPSWLAEPDSEAEVSKATQVAPPKRYDPPLSRKTARIAFLCFGVAVVGVTVYRNLEPHLSTIAQALVLISLGGLMYVLGWLLDGRGHSRPLESDVEPSLSLLPSAGRAEPTVGPIA